MRHDVLLFLLAAGAGLTVLFSGKLVSLQMPRRHGGEGKRKATYPTVADMHGGDDPFTAVDVDEWLSGVGGSAERHMKHVAVEGWEQALTALQAAQDAGQPDLVATAARLADRMRVVASAHNHPPNNGVHLVDVIDDAWYNPKHPLLPPVEYRTDRMPSPLFRYPEELGGADAPINGVPHALVSYLPRIYILPSFYTRAEANELRAEAEALFADTSAGAVRIGDTPQNRGVAFAVFPATNELAADLGLRVRAITGWGRAPVSQLMMYRYTAGQLMARRHELPTGTAVAPGVAAATFTVFLNDNYAGGAASFPSANTAEASTDGVSCDGGLRVKPVAGTAVLHYSVRPDRARDPHAWYTHCRVEEGTKYVLVLHLEVPAQEA